MVQDTRQQRLTALNGARRGDPDTSWEATLGRLTGKGQDRLKALQLHAAAERQDRIGGLTDFELAEQMDRQQTSAGKRRGELRDLGLVEDSGYRRPAPSGSPAIVWWITRKGHAALSCLE